MNKQPASHPYKTVKIMGVTYEEKQKEGDEDPFLPTLDDVVIRVLDLTFPVLLGRVQIIGPSGRSDYVSPKGKVFFPITGDILRRDGRFIGIYENYVGFHPIHPISESKYPRHVLRNVVIGGKTYEVGARPEIMGPPGFPTRPGDPDPMFPRAGDYMRRAHDLFLVAVWHYYTQLQIYKWVDTKGKEVKPENDNILERGKNKIGIYDYYYGFRPIHMKEDFPPAKASSSRRFPVATPSK
ncbi:uncharacterized protein LOC117179027 [Belonocnema kinseyi]|uniref:uncharacterized protein LOC117179027 n=1 Tax=Belonocnema kinseyi TaxID=2817044 RepID=UPI00143D282B|nr:uncharacterized protein LOC117179027 [Belonocnema kinseyi]